MARLFLRAALLAIAALSLGTEAVSLPPCQAAAPAQKTLDQVRTASVDLPGPPFGLAYSRFHQDIAFVGLGFDLGVLNTSTFPPQLLHSISLPVEYQNVPANGTTGIALTDDERYVLVTAFTKWLLVVDTKKAIAGDADALAAAIPGSTPGGNTAIEVTPFHDYAFVSQENGFQIPGNFTHKPGTIEVFKLKHQHSFPSSKNSSVTGNATGYIPLGVEVVGTALSHDKRILYATSEGSYPPQEIGSIPTPAGPEPNYEGTLSLLDVHRLTTDPANSLIANVSAGCTPVRVAVAPDGKTVWVTARQSNYLIAYDAQELLRNASNALVASVQVGTAPVGLIFTKDGKRILTADSDRFSQTNVTGLTVVDVEAALRGESAALGRIPTGMFPREFALSPDGNTILVADYDSNHIQAIDVSSLP